MADDKSPDRRGKPRRRVSSSWLIVMLSFSFAHVPHLSCQEHFDQWNESAVINGSFAGPAEIWMPSNLDAEIDNALVYDDAAGSSLLPGLAEVCNKTACQLPNCYCDSHVIPNGLLANQTPQMLMVAFDGAINMHNYDLYRQIFNDDRRNPNGCPIRATFFLSHRWTDYSHVQNLYAFGHEIALRGVA
jgi:hypothetical protein